MLNIVVPVECQNGHKALWHITIEGLEVKRQGVPFDDKCDCPKWLEGQGYRAVGEPRIVR